MTYKKSSDDCKDGMILCFNFQAISWMNPRELTIPLFVNAGIILLLTNHESKAFLIENNKEEFSFISKRRDWNLASASSIFPGFDGLTSFTSSTSNSISW